MASILEEVQSRLAAIDDGLDERATKVVRDILPGVFGFDTWEAFQAGARGIDASAFFGGSVPKRGDVVQAALRGTPYDGYAIEDVEFAYHILRQASRQNTGLRVEKWDRERHERIIAAASPGDLRAMDSAESGFGLEFVGTQYVNSLWEAARAQYRIASLFQAIPMTAASAVAPVESAIPEMIFAAESTANNSANYATSKTGTAKQTLTAKKLLIHQMWSGEIEEDSIVPWVPFLRRQLAVSVAHYTDSLLLNGDTTNAGTGNINLDDADPADTKHYLALDGIRHNGLVDNTANSKDMAGPVNPTEILLARGRMRTAANFFDWGADPADLAIIVDFQTYLRLVDFDEVITIDKMGSAATILNGQLASIYGVPVIYSPTMSLTEADGKVSTTGANNVKGQLVTVSRSGWLVGERRRLAIEFERIPATDQSRLVASIRIGFENADTEVSDVIYNITV